MSTEQQESQADIVIELSDLDLDQTDTGQTNIAQRVQNNREQLEQARAPIWAERMQRNHQTLRHAVKRFWINGVLEDSLHTELYIRLGQHEDQHDFVAPPPLWGLTYQHINQPDPNEPTAASVDEIAEIFSEMNQQMLILGDPGSGKTITLLCLAEALLAETSDDLLPVPVVFNLSSWSQNRLPFAEWLVQELVENYYMPRGVSQSWIANDELVLLLDGLDEVAVDQQVACARAINAFREEHPVGIAICCRAEEYSVFDEEIELEGTVTIAPLTEEQIDSYIDAVQPYLVWLDIALEASPPLRLLAQTPLFLTMMALRYSDQNQAAEYPPLTDRDEQQHFFDQYIRYMIRQKAEPLYGTQLSSIMPLLEPPAKALQRLQWLAEKMVGNGQSIFQIEQVEQDSFVNIIGQFINFSTTWLLYALYSGLMAGLFMLVGFGPIAGVIFGLIFGYVLRTESNIIEHQTIRHYRDLMLSNPLLRAIWSDRRWMMIFFAVFVFRWFANIILLGLLGLLIFGPIWVLFDEIGPAEAAVKVAPNQGTRQFVKNGVATVLAIWLVTGLALGLLYRMTGVQGGSVLLGMVHGLVLGLTGGLSAGLFRATNHVARRIFLASTGHVPRNYARFLDTATSRLLLRRVGGGYIFANRMILEHIANLSQTEIELITHDLQAESQKVEAARETETVESERDVQ